MTATEFLKQLEKNLHTLRPEERETAMAYYREYLEEAGDNVTEAVAGLGSPQSVATQILRECSTDRARQNKTGTSHNGNILFGIVVLLVKSPFWMTVLFLWVTVLFVLAVLVLSFAVAALVAVVQGILFLTEQLLGDGLWNIGAGLLCAGLTMLIWKPCIVCIIKLTNRLGKWVSGNCCRLFRKEDETCAL